ncbi:hypothetical protein NE237_025035 [Protea cynaroides]|uniref:Uncharacterized protein n=1 Tax=Protea cynaroides TaxID=273540 RepID=A0A9Q0H6A3_9MAGN|nr:hypothetical protein NE237_025035 [Protea cynaroides]
MLCLCYQKESYEPLLETPEEKEESHHQLPPLTVPKGFVPIVVGDLEGKEEKKYIIQVEYLSTPTFRAMINKIWEEQHMELDLEDEKEGPMKLPCTPADFEQVLEACDEENCKDRRRCRFHKSCAEAGGH